jgi:hypothetical protein
MLFDNLFPSRQTIASAHDEIMTDRHNPRLTQARRWVLSAMEIVSTTTAAWYQAIMLKTLLAIVLPSSFSRLSQCELIQHETRFLFCFRNSRTFALL